MIKPIARIGVFFVLCVVSGKLLMAGTDVITEGKKVSFRYTLTIDGKTVDSSRTNEEPLTYVQGAGHMLPGVEKQLEGMKAGDKKTFSVSQEEGYGPVNPKAVVQVPAVKLPKGAQPGMVLTVKNAEGREMPAIIKVIQGDKATLDFNHPLAGKTLQFAVEIISVA